MPRISVEGMKFYYQQAGEGPDVVLLHGVTGNMAIWPLINLMPTLAADFRVTAYDLRGHGYSDTPPTGYTSADMAGDLVKIQQALGLGPMYVLGHSFGGVIALHAAVLYPDAIAGLILSDPYFPGLRHLETSLSEWSGWQEYKEQAGRAGLQVSEEDWFDVGQLFEQTANLPPERHEMFRKELGLAAMDSAHAPGRHDLRRGCQGRRRIDGGTHFARCGIRPSLCYGENSPFLATCRYLEANLTNCRVAVVANAGHRAHEENPAGYVALVQQLLRELPTRGARRLRGEAAA